MSDSNRGMLQRAFGGFNGRKKDSAVKIKDGKILAEDAIGIEVASAQVNGAYEDLTKAQQSSVKWLVSVLLQAYRLKTSDIYRHPQVSYKESSEAQHVQPLTAPQKNRTTK